MGIIKQVLTGADNETVAWGRYVGLAMMVLVAVTPIAELLSVAYKRLTIEQWGAMLSQWQVFLPIMLGATALAVGGTAFTEPKPKE